MKRKTKAYSPKVGDRTDVTLRVKGTEITFTAIVHNYNRKEYLIQPLGCDTPTLIVTRREATFTPTL